jgi:hypothetical protein
MGLTLRGVEALLAWVRLLSQVADAMIEAVSLLPICLYPSIPDSREVAITLHYRHYSGSRVPISSSGYRKSGGLSRFPYEGITKIRRLV